MRLLPGLGRKCILLYEPEKVFGGCKCRLIFEKKIKIQKLKQMWLFLNSLYVTVLSLI